MALNKKIESPEVLIPMITEDVTVEWLEKVLNMKIDSKSLTTVGNINASVGFLSNLVRVSFHEITPGGDKKKHNIVVKLLPPDHDSRELVRHQGMDRSELHFYQTLMAEILNEVPSLESYFCPFLYGRIQEEDLDKKIPYASVVVLRDLKSDGYILKPFNTAELTEEEIDLTIDFLANFHVAAAMLEMKKQTPLSEVYDDVFPDWFYPNDNKDRQVAYHGWFVEGFKDAKKLIMDYVTDFDPSQISAGEEMVAKLVEPFDPYAQKIFNEVLRAGQLFPSMVHGDVWQNNIMISTEAIKIIDWQTTGYTDSVYDVSYFLITTLYPHFELNRFKRRGKLYFDRLEKMYAQKEKEGIDFSGRRRRSWEEFWQAMKTYGATFVFIIYIMHCKGVVGMPENYPKVYKILHFLYYTVGISPFLMQITK